MQSDVLNNNGMALLQERSSVKQFLSEELCYISKCSLLRKEFNCSLVIHELNREWSISDSNQPTILSISKHFLWQWKVDSVWPGTDLAQLKVVLGETLQSPSFPLKQILVVSFTFSSRLPKWQNCNQKVKEVLHKDIHMGRNKTRMELILPVFSCSSYPCNFYIILTSCHRPYR